MLQGVTDDVLEEVFCEVLVVFGIVEGHFRFNHPELCQVACGVRIFRTESGSEGVNLSQSHGSQFPFQLTGNSQVGFTLKKVLAKVDFSILCFGRVE